MSNISYISFDDIGIRAGVRGVPREDVAFVTSLDISRPRFL